MPGRGGLRQGTYGGALEVCLIATVDRAVERLDVFAGEAALLGDLVSEGNVHRFGPGIGPPQAAAQERFGAVKIALGHALCVTSNAGLSRSTNDSHSSRSSSNRAAAHAQGLTRSGHQKDHRKTRVREHVLQREQQLVALAVGDQQRVFIDHAHEARRFTLR